LKLSDYAGKKVKIIDIDNKIYKGIVLGYTKAIDNDENEASIDVFPTKTSVSGVELFESEIKSIEII
jgi:hypothetical protein